MAGLRVLTANLFNGRARPAAVARLLDQEQPDIVAVQELAPNVAGELTARYPHGSVDPRYDYRGLGVVARFPIEVEPLRMPERWGRVARWEDRSGPVELLDVHFANPIDRPLGRTRQIRREQLAAVFGHIGQNPDIRRIVVGDFNASPSWPLYRRFADVLTDAAATAGTARRTWGPKVSWTPRLLRIDHVFVHGIEPVATHIAPVAGSDHHALIADLELD